MKRKINLCLLLVILLCFSTTVGADQTILWTDNAGDDPLTDEGWLIDEGTLAGWTDSNFETLEYQTAGKSEVVGTGITVDGIKVNWSYPGSGHIGKGEDLAGGEGRLDQSIDYKVVAFADIPCVLEMDIVGNGGRSISKGINNSNSNNDEFVPLNEENDTPEQHLLVFSPSRGGIVDADWNFTNTNAIDYAKGQSEGVYINGCDLFTANLWANAPYGFSVSSAGMKDFAGLEDPLLIEMRCLENGGTSQESSLSSYSGEEANNSEWAGEYVLNEDGIEIGSYEAGQKAHINMQFRIPVTGIPAGRYQGEVTFSTYTI